MLFFLLRDSHGGDDTSVPPFALQNKIFPRIFVVIGLRFAGVEDGDH